MYCTNHPSVEAETRCDACAEPFCQACIVEVQGEKLCAACKVVVVKDRKSPPPRPIQQGVICDEARNALLCAVGGLLCCCIGLILHPIALIMAHQAVEKIKYDQRLVGIELARAAQVTAIVGLIFTVITGFVYMLAVVANLAEEA